MPLPNAGEQIEASDWTDVFPQGVDAWTPYTPTLTQGATVTKTVTRAVSTKVGRTVTVQYSLVATSAGTAANLVMVGLPEATAADGQIGVAYILDANTNVRYVLTAYTFGTAMIFQNDASTGGNSFGVSPAITLASGDQIAGAITYEAAS